MATIGILGIGGLAGLLMRGFAGTPHRFILSPRGAANAVRLARDFGAEIAGSNQEVVDRAEAVLVCLPAATGAEDLAQLRFRPGQRVLSAMAGTGLARLAEVTGPAIPAIGMMPGYANAFGLGPCLLHPRDPFWAEVLAPLGPVLPFDDEATFTAAATFGAFSGATVAFMAHAIRWFEGKGLDPATARTLVAGTLRGNAEVLLREPASVEAIAAGTTTPGGITLQLLDILDRRGAMAAWDEAMDAVHARISTGG